ncbi:hypothetical protein T01_4755 [Trichinella spiralis]|uniref:Uncharacterized protein n=1 Tax=Trichinella spiralis TaxID=6334 RepID=A0A0V1ARI3_TRISP|nr:hypothetical protein T01_4755 [Trichinella spiralis]
MGFRSYIRSRSSSTPIGPLSFFRPLRESLRPRGVDIDHFGYPCFRGILNYRLCFRRADEAHTFAFLDVYSKTPLVDEVMGDGEKLLHYPVTATD